VAILSDSHWLKANLGTSRPEESIFTYVVPPFAIADPSENNTKKQFK
jgi:hypothetical protein